MINKENDIPLYLEKLQALERRLTSTHPKYQKVVDDYSRRMAGYKGEKSLDYYLSFLSKDKYTILHNLRIYNGEYYFQIDILLITEKFILIIEVKNYSGVIHYDTNFNQLIRTQNGKEEALPNPLAQIERQKFQLITLLNKRNISYVPIETLAVISNPLTVIKSTTNHNNVSQKLLHSATLSKRIKELEQEYQELRLSRKEIRSLSKYLLKVNQPIEMNILDRFNITNKDILTGVQCPNCGIMPMERLHGRWSCKQCNHISKDAHIKAIRDYRLLIGKDITNQEARQFLNISSIHTTKRLLTALNLRYTGSNKKRQYVLP
ncbi:NERD domain-containing protein [Bacillus sp. BGMRC 2118]|nr:NERD domain-containing protein [Bacillus sp. BGMRC 2118]